MREGVAGTNSPKFQLVLGIRGDGLAPFSIFSWISSWSNAGLILTHLGPYLGLAWPLPWPILALSWLYLGPILAPSWLYRDPILARVHPLVSSWPILGSILAWLGHFLGLFWPSWAYLGSILALSWLIFIHLGPFLARVHPLVSSWPILGPILAWLDHFLGVSCLHLGLILVVS